MSASHPSRRKKAKHPMQPFVKDKRGVVRFKENSIIAYLFTSKQPLDMNALAGLDFPREDRVQLAQLLGYSLAGFGELSYVSNATYADAVQAADPLLKRGGKAHVR